MVTTYIENKPTEEAHRALLKDAHPDWSKEHCDRVITAFTNSNYAISVLDDKDNLVGTVRVFTDQVGFAMIADLLVHPKYRLQGIGSQLVTMCESHFSGFYIYADPQSKELDSFYEKNGYAKHNLFRKQVIK